MTEVVFVKEERVSPVPETCSLDEKELRIKEEPCTFMEKLKKSEEKYSVEIETVKVEVVEEPNDINFDEDGQLIRSKRYGVSTDHTLARQESGPCSRMANNISPEVLIPLVEQRSVIWDKNIEIYKDKELKLAAWREICCVFDPNFDALGEKERKAFATKISTKWTHIRDAYMRSLKKEKEEKLSGAGAKTGKPYVYKKQLSFLLYANEPRMTQDSCHENYNSTSDTCSDTAIDDQLPPGHKKSKIDTDDKMIQDSKLGKQENPHVSFIKGVLPSLALFDDDENLEFQMGILELIKNIKKKRHDNNLHGTHAQFRDYPNHLIESKGYFTGNNNCDPDASTSTSNLICDDQVVNPSVSPTLSNHTDLSNTQDSFNCDSI